jgi:hypothetical protein
MIFACSCFAWNGWKFSPEHRDGAGLQWKFTHVLERGPRCSRLGSLELACPADVALSRAETERNRFVVSIEKDGERIANDTIPMFTNFGDLIAGQHHAETPRESRRPIAIGHFSPVGLEPVEVFDLRAVNRPSLKEIASTKDGLRFAQAHNLADEIQ